jgi:hypothetical protein
MRRLLLILALSFAALLATAWPIALARGSEAAPLEGRLTLIALHAPGPWEPARKAEPPAERFERLATIARAVALESAHPPEGWRWGSAELAAALLMTSYYEGWRWRRDVHDGTKLGDAGRARCLMQLHRHPTWMPKGLWLASTGTDLESTRICVAGAARVLAHYAAECATAEAAKRDLEGSLARVLVGYGTGSACSPKGRPWATERARHAVRWLGEIRR